MDREKKKRVFENIVRLRRAERTSPGNSDIGAVRMDLERELGGSVSRAFAAELLGVSHTALNRWIDRGDIPVVITPRGSKAVSLSTLAKLYEDVNETRASGRQHALEPVVLKGRERVDDVKPRRLIADERGGSDSHRAAELRSLAYHREVARRLDRPMVDEALGLINHWRRAETIDPRYASEWEALLNEPIAEIRKVIRGDGQRARDLRQNSPFAGVLSEGERKKIVSEIR